MKKSFGFQVQPRNILKQIPEIFSEALIGLTEKEAKVCKWIDDILNLPAYGAVFHGAAVLMKEETPGYINLVSHAGRDIMNGLARTYRGDTRIQVQYNQLVENIKLNWKPIEIPLNKEEMPDKITFNISQNAHDKIKNLFKEHDKGKERSGSADEAFFQTFLKMDINADILPMGKN